MNFAQNQSLKIFLTSFVILIISIIMIYNYNYSNLNRNHLEFSEDNAHKISINLENHFIEKIKTARTIAITPIISAALEESNWHYSRLSKQQRDKEIQFNDDKWKTIDDKNNQFILKYTNNTVSQYLKNQQDNLKGEYGEIFITDKYGALIASTAKLTTFAHGHKYWWQGSFNDGEGAVFLDDRGYDDSAKGYVLGVVVPIKNGNEIIGILKANLNILGSISDLILNSMLEEDEQLILIRSGGLIVFEEGLEPLSKRVPAGYLENLQTEEHSFISKIKGSEGIIGISEIGITAGKQGYVFGGSFESIDHKKGNTGESWYILEFYPISHIVDPANENLRNLIWVGFFLSIILAIISMIIGNRAAEPLKKLIQQSKQITMGDYNAKVFTKRTDEIGQLAASFNQMTKNLKETTTSIDNLNTEITERKKAKLAVKKEHARFKNIMDTNPSGIYIVDKKYNLEYINPILEKDFGQINGRKCYSYFHDLTKPCEWCKHEEVFAGKSVRWEWFSKKSNKYYELFDTPLENPDGTISKFEIFFDITKRKKAEDKILTSEKRYKYLFEKSPISIWEEDFSELYKYINSLKKKGIENFRDYFIKNPDEVEKCTKMIRVLDINEMTLKLFNAKTKTELITNLGFMFIEESRVAFIEQFCLIAKNLTSFSLETINKTIDGKVLNVLLNWAVVPGHEKDYSKVLVIVIDITEKKRSEVEIEMSSERLKMLNKIIRHDLSNDFAVINSAVNIFKKDSDVTMLDEIKKRVKKSLNAIAGYRKYESFIDSNTNLEEIEINEVVNELIAEFPDIKINIEGKCKVFADDALYSVFKNLMSNSIQHGNSSKIDINITSNKDTCKIKFIDNGTGIADNIKDKIFDEGFFHGKSGHTGIGLHIIKKTIESYNGFVSVEDNEPNGAVFVISLRKILVD